jgi:hypothetical protein
MFDTTSRYAGVPVATHQMADGRVVTFVRRRFLPAGAAIPLLVEVTVASGDRLDLVTATTLGDPEQSWRVADANDAMHPADLVADPGRALRIPVPQF